MNKLRLLACETKKRNWFQKRTDFGFCAITHGMLIASLVGGLAFWLFFYMFAWSLHCLIFV